MLVSVFFLAAASDCVVHGLRLLTRPMSFALRRFGNLLALLTTRDRSAAEPPVDPHENLATALLDSSDGAPE